MKPFLILLLITVSAFAEVRVENLNTVLVPDMYGKLHNAGIYEDVILNYPTLKTEINAAVTTAITALKATNPEAAQAMIVDVAKRTPVRVSDQLKAEVTTACEQRKAADIVKAKAERKKANEARAIAEFIQ